MIGNPNNKTREKVEKTLRAAKERREWVEAYIRRVKEEDGPRPS